MALRRAGPAPPSSAPTSPTAGYGCGAATVAAEERLTAPPLPALPLAMTVERRQRRTRGGREGARRRPSAAVTWPATAGAGGMEVGTATHAALAQAAAVHDFISCYLLS